MKESYGEREGGPVLMAKETQSGQVEDEKRQWYTPGHGSAGIRRRSQNFYSHLKNTLRRKNANNETRLFHVWVSREKVRVKREKEIFFFIPNAPVKKMLC